MLNKEYSSLLLDQSNDLIWMVDADLLLTYANQAYLNLMKQITGKEKNLQETVLLEGFGEGYIEKWTGYYKKALSGDYFEIEEHYSHPETNEIKYGQIIFNPIRDENNQIVSVACQSRDITRIVKQRSDVHQLMDASLDVFCTVNEAGNFVFVSEAASKHWGYTPNELIGKPYVSFIIEDDIPKTNEIAKAILSGEEIKAFVNRYKRKDGGIAYNQWSARWDYEAKLMYCVARDAKENIEQENLLLQSEQRFKALVQDGADMISIIDLNGRYSYTSPTTTGILGITPEEFQGRTVFDFIHPDDIERAAGYMQRISIESKVFVEPFRLRNGNNEWRWIETVLTNMLDNPAVNGIVANSRDITENINLIKSIEANEQFNKTVIESSPDCLKILDKDGGLLYMNFNGLYQMEIDDFSAFKNKKWWIFWGPENEALVRESVDKALKGETVQFTAFCPTAKGTPKWWDVMVSPVINAGEPIEKIVSVSRDITAKKEEEQRLKLLESVITNANDAVLITEAEPFNEPGPRILYVNEAFTRMTGYTAEEVIGKSPRILQGPNSDRAELARLSKAMRSWEPCEITTINYKKNGEEFWINMSISPVADEKGWFTHWISIERDVTEKKKLELANNLSSKVSAAFNVEPDLSSALSKVCEEAATIGQFSFCEIWLTDIQESLIDLKAAHKNDDAATIFYENSKIDTGFEKGQGVPGKIWENTQPIIWEHKGKNQELLFRSSAAEKAGIKTIIGVPLMYHNRFIGVLQFGTQAITKNVDWIITVLEDLGAFIGGEIVRKKIEIELAQIFEFAPDIIITAGFDGYIKRINPAGLELLGYSLEEMISRPIISFIHEQDRLLTRDKQLKLYSNEALRNFENRYITKEGKIVWLSWTSTSLPDQGIVYAVAKNITEEKSLRELNRLVGELAKIGSWEVDLQKNKVYYSEMVHQLHETDPQNYEPDLTGVINFYREDFRPMVTEAVNQCIQSGTPFDFEAVLVTSNKNELWVRVIGNAELLNGECIRIYGSFQDIHDRKEADLRLLSLADNLPGVVFQFQLFPDGTSKFLNLSKGAEKLYGIDAELIMKNNSLIWDQVVAGGDFDKVQASIGESLATLTNWHVIYRNKLPNSKIIWLEGWGTPRRLPDGSTIWDSIVLEITDLKETEQLLDSASKLARVGSWEIVLKENEEIKVFWSSMTKNILEIDESFEPTIANGINFYKEPSRSLMEAAVNKAIETGEAFDLELELVSGKGNDIWIRCIGDAQYENGKVTRVFGSFQDINTRKVAELNQLKLIEEKSNILESISDYFYAMDGELNFTYMNSSAANLLAVNKEKIIGKNLFTVFPDIKNTLFEDELRKVQNTAEATKFEYYYAPFEAWFEESIYPTPTGISVYFVDITQRKIANAEIAKSEEKRRLIMNGALDAIVTIDTNETITFWNAQAEVIFGWKSEEVMGKPLSEMIIPEAFRKYHVEGIKNYLKTGKGKALNVLLELSAIRKNGEEFPIELTVIPIKQGGEEFFCAFIRDITQRKKAERELIENENYLRTILDNEPECVKVLNSKGELLSMNPAGLAMIEADNEQQVLGQRMTDLVNKEYQLGFNRLSKEVFKGNAGSFEFEITGLKGGRRWLETHAVPLKDTTGKVVNLLGVTRDITEQKKAEEKLLNAFNEKTSILESISDYFYALDGDLNFTYMNSSCANFLAVKKEKIIGKNLFAEFPDLKNTQLDDELRKVQNTAEASKFEFYYAPFDTWFEESIYPTPVGISLYFVDITQRKKAEAARIMAEKNYQELFDKSNDAIYIYDIDTGQLIDVNYRATEVTGFDKIDLLEKAQSLLFTDNPEYSMEKALGYIQKAAQGKPQVFEWLAKKKDGASCWFEMTLKRTSIAGVDKILAFQRDITERKQSEEKLIESEQKFRQLSLQLQLQQIHLTSAQEVAKVGSWETDLSNLKLTWSDETYRIFGTHRESFDTTHENFLNYVHPDDREKVNKALIDSTQATAPTQYSIEHRIITASGEVKVVEEQWKVTFGDKGEPLMAIGSCQDISERKKAEKELVEERRLLRAIIDNIPVNVYVKDNSFKKILSNKTDVKFAGFQDEKSVLGKTDFEIFNNITSQNSYEQDFQVIQSKESIIGLETQLVKNDGTEAWLLVSKIPLLDEKEEVTGLVGVSVDITERRKSQQLLLESERTLSSILNSLDEVVWAISLPDSKLVLISNSFDKVFGKSIKIWKRKFLLWKEVILPEDKWIGERIEKEVIAQGQSNGIFRIKDAQGNIKWLENSVKIIRNEQDEPVMVIGTSTDITERKNAEDALTSAQELAEEANRSKAELELRALQMQMNPHFIFNALNSIQSYILNQDTLTANLYLTKFSRLIRLFLDSSRSKFIPLSEEINLLTLYIELEKIRFDNKFEFEILFEGHVNKNIEIPTMILQPFIENAINHGLRYKQQKGLLSIKFHKEQNYLICTIEDDGVGRKNSAIIKDKPIEGYKSQGLKITAERLVTYNKINDANIVFSIRDRIEPPNSPSEDIGTVIEVRFPEI